MERHLLNYTEALTQTTCSKNICYLIPSYGVMNPCGTGTTARAQSIDMDTVINANFVTAQAQWGSLRG